MIDLRLGDFRAVFDEGSLVDSVIVDPPYGRGTHDGATSDRSDGSEMRDVGYHPWTERDIYELTTWFVVRKWFVIFTSHDLIDAATRSLARVGLTTFAPVPIIFPDSVRLQGDGPANAAVYLVVARTKSAHKWRSLPGWYKATRERGAPITGAKPLDLMRAIVKDYSDVGDLVVDPCAGWGTTLLAAAQTGRKASGAEMDPKTHAAAIERLKARAGLFA